MRSLTYYLATSLDGRIAAPDGGFSAFLDSGDHMEMVVRDWTDALPAPALEALGITPDNDTFDTVLMGWNTYAVGLPFGVTNPYPHLEQVVFSRSHGQDEVADAIRVVADDPVAEVQRLRKEDGAGIWLCGGGRLAATLADEIDRLASRSARSCSVPGSRCSTAATTRARSRSRPAHRTRRASSSTTTSVSASRRSAAGTAPARARRPRRPGSPGGRRRPDRGLVGDQDLGAEERRAARGVERDRRAVVAGDGSVGEAVELLAGGRELDQLVRTGRPSRCRCGRSGRCRSRRAGRRAGRSTASRGCPGRPSCRDRQPESAPLVGSVPPPAVVCWVISRSCWPGR